MTNDVITFNINCYLDYSKPKEGYAYHKTDYSAMRQYLELTKWKENYIVLGANQNVEEAWNNLKIKLMELREKFVPKKIKLPKPSWNNKGSFPVDKSLQDAIRNKRATHHQWMSVKYLNTTTNITSLRYVRARLIGKLKSCDIKGKLLNWIIAFLNGCTQLVKVNGSESTSSCVLSGISQGSVLGPILFEDIESHVLLFADDVKIFKHISSREDSVALQADINSVESWSKTWLLTFHPDKCHVLTIGKFTNVRHTHRYKVYDKELEHVFAEKDLAVVIDGDLNFEEHMSEKINKANTVMRMIRRTFSFLDCHLFKKLYTTFVRPHLEYAHPVSSPHLLKHISIIENVQKRATKLVDGLHNYSQIKSNQKIFSHQINHNITICNHKLAGNTLYMSRGPPKAYPEES